MIRYKKSVLHIISIRPSYYNRNLHVGKYARIKPARSQLIKNLTNHHKKPKNNNIVGTVFSQFNLFITEESPGNGQLDPIPNMAYSEPPRPTVNLRNERNGRLKYRSIPTKFEFTRHKIKIKLNINDNPN